jgi:imidazoleglycerol-phosphate dehydratase
VRVAEGKRETTETQVSVKLNLDGTGESRIRTGLKYLDHLLASFSKHSLIDLEVTAKGDLTHHVVEDVAIVLGEALDEAMGDKAGIYRFGYSFVAMDDSLSRVVLDCSGRGYAVIDIRLRRSRVEDLPREDAIHFLQTLSQKAKINLHVATLYGDNDHHKLESVFKATAVALRTAVSFDPRRGNQKPSSKGAL